ncbi:hypothetical protein JCM14722_23470 [Pseudodesulfovibrio portus]|uniref:Uncharacterized protein n=1 Tax=Pseudodesulfovibrio portus TaxID=231439 RepID=A0ABM8ATP3_9BACT|nr:hypothetical protein JCM14722_23470 [Pseudodesulfovibrio portus]
MSDSGGKATRQRVAPRGLEQIYLDNEKRRQRSDTARALAKEDNTVRLGRVGQMCIFSGAAVPQPYTRTARTAASRKNVQMARYRKPGPSTASGRGEM